MSPGAGPRLRLATEDDATACLAIYGPVIEGTAISFELEPPSLEEMRERIRVILERTPWLVVEDEAAVWGYAYAGPFRARPAYQWTTEVTVYVHPRHHRKGVGKALYTALLSALRALGYRSAVGGMTLPNPASMALHEALGFRAVGAFKAAGFKFGGWHDVGFWQLELRGHEAPLGPPRLVASLLGTPPWEAALRAGAEMLSRP